jgi:phosphoribosylformylglycinamidine synthase
MPRFNIEIKVMPRPTLLDPQGKAVEHALTALDFETVDNVRIGKVLTLTVESDSRERAEQEATTMCERLLANPVTEDFEFSVSET